MKPPRLIPVDRRRLLCGLLGAVLFWPLSLSAQLYHLTPEERARYTPENPYERFEDGRPRVPDELLETMREMEIEIEEAWAILRREGYPNQYDGGWNVLLPEQKLVGRAFTIQFMPTRADVAGVIESDAAERGIPRFNNQVAIDMLGPGDVPVVDMFGKIEGGTFVGDKLAYYIRRTTGTGLVVDGALFYLQRLEESGMPAYYRGTHPGSISNVMLTGLNVPVRIGQAIVMPGDIVLGDRDGVLFIPPHLVEVIIESARTQRLRDEWIKAQFDTGRYKSSEIYGRPTDPELLREFEEYISRGGGQLP
jgi:4-hydroxy-4-methyl-2-oxoglutarate aldolase